MDRFYTGFGVLDVITSGNILDLGCGQGSGLIALAENPKFIIDAVDKDAASIDFLNKKIKAASIGNIHTHATSIEDFKIEQEKYSIIVAQNSLPFISSKEKVIEIFSNIANGLKQGGFIYVTLFGPKHEWKDTRKISTFSFDEATNIFDDLGLKRYFVSTEEGYVKLKNGEVRFWDSHRLIYQK